MRGIQYAPRPMQFRKNPPKPGHLNVAVDSINEPVQSSIDWDAIRKELGLGPAPKTRIPEFPPAPVKRRRTGNRG